MIDLTIEELDMLTDGISAWENVQHMVPNFAALTAQEAQGPFQAERNAQEALQREMRARMEAATLLKARLINEKTVLQAANIAEQTDRSLRSGFPFTSMDVGSGSEL